LISLSSVYVKSSCIELHFRDKLTRDLLLYCLSVLSDLANVGLGFNVSAVSNGLAKEECDGLCSAFDTLLVDLTDVACNIPPERDGDNRAVATSFPPIIPRWVCKHDAVKLHSSSHSLSATLMLWYWSTDSCVTALFEIHNWIPRRLGVTVVTIPQALRLV
jgi:hypothetical protein